MYIFIDGQKSGLNFSASHMIADHPKCSSLHGHTYSVSIRLHGEPSQDGFIYDFGPIKTMVRSLIEDLDHKLLVPARSKQLKVEKVSNDEGPALEIRHSHKLYMIPSQDAVLLDIEAVTAENLATYFLKRFCDSFNGPENITMVEIGVNEGWGQGAWVKKEL